MIKFFLIIYNHFHFLLFLFIFYHKKWMQKKKVKLQTLFIHILSCYHENNIRRIVNFPSQKVFERKRFSVSPYEYIHTSPTPNMV